VGERFKEINFTINGDYWKEVNEKIVVELSDATGGVISKSTAIGQIAEVDVSTMSAEYSLTDINPNLVGYAFRVRRSSDDQELDIGFNKYGNLDTQALLKFVNDNDTGAAVNGASGHVVTWYDQSGLGRDLEQSEAIKQGTIVHNGAVLTMSDGSAAIVFNESDALNVNYNGAYDLSGSVAGVNDTTGSWMRTKDIGDHLKSRSLEVYMTYQYAKSSSGLLFNLGDDNNEVNRIAPTAPYTDGRTYWDALKDNRYYRYGRLTVDNVQSPDTVQDLVFTANSNNNSTGTAVKNYVDAVQAIFIDGENVAHDSDLYHLPLQLGESWMFMGYTHADLNRVVSGRINQFLVYADEVGDLPTSPQTLYGSSSNNTFTYAAETTVTAIDGIGGFNIIELDATSNLDTTSVDILSIDLINMDNGSNANQLTINDTQLDSNGSILSVLMGANDTVVYETNTLNYDNAIQEMIVFATNGDDEINMSILNEVVYGRGGNDTFIYNSWSDIAPASTDTIVDFGIGANSDVIDLSDLLTYSGSDTLSDFVEVTGGNIDGGDVTIKIDKDGSNAFNAADQTIILTGVGSTTTDVTLDLLNEHNFVVL
ncbi:MAG: type I secretion C-terminal target domain-containing protein, partial [Gammaproteobacteria bacterium]|nr:type I secretion C-terminal target domain-containing protein [Gammaproteobacteria bacterium]